MKSKKKVRKTSARNREFLALMDAYAKATGKTTVNLNKVADWALANNLYKPPPPDHRKKLAKDMQTAAREDYIADENGEPVRRRHAYKPVLGDEQLTLWVNIEDANPDEMRLCVKQRRSGIESDVKQLDRDVKHYNKNFNHGDPIAPSFDFTKDMEENAESSEYNDTPPPDDQDEGSGEPSSLF